MIQLGSHGALLVSAQVAVREQSESLVDSGCCIHDGSICEDRRRVAPLRLLPIEHSQVPKYAFALAAARLRGNLAVQLPCDEMVTVPILDKPVGLRFGIEPSHLVATNLLGVLAPTPQGH